MKGSFSSVAAATTFLSAKNTQTIRVPTTSRSTALISNLNRFKREANAFKTDFLTDAAIDFIKSKDKKPWFLYLSYTAPHTPLQAKPKDIAANTHIKDPKPAYLCRHDDLSGSQHRPATRASRSAGPS